MKWTGIKSHKIQKKEKIEVDQKNSKFIIRKHNKGNHVKLIEKSVCDEQTDTNSNSNNCQIMSDQKSAQLMNEEEKLRTRIMKVRAFWDKSSLYIPNVFKIKSYIDEESEHLLEYQDLSLKEVLVFNGGFKSRNDSLSTSDILLKDNHESTIKRPRVAN